MFISVLSEKQLRAIIRQEIGEYDRRSAELVSLHQQAQLNKPATPELEQVRAQRKARRQEFADRYGKR